MAAAAAATLFKKKSADKTIAESPWTGLWTFSEDGARWFCCHADCAAKAEHKTRSTFGKSNAVDHYKSMHFDSCPPSIRADMIKVWRAQEAELSKIKSAVVATSTVTTRSRITAPQLRELLVVVTAEYKMPFTWVEKPLKAVLIEVAPEMRIFSADTLTRDTAAMVCVYPRRVHPPAMMRLLHRIPTRVLHTSRRE